MKKKQLYVGVGILAIGFIALVWYLNVPGEFYSFSNNRFSYTHHRGLLHFTQELLYTHNSVDVYKITFESRPFISEKTTLVGLLFMPQENKRVPGIVFLPAGSAPKEGREDLWLDLAEHNGYAVLAIDQRGIGETGGTILGLEDDYIAFVQGYEPIQHLSVFDALRSFDVLREIKGVDKNTIALVGESMGGRYAIIAASLDDRIQGVISISGAGYVFNENDFAPYLPFLNSIDPDTYVSDLKKPIILLHDTADTVVPYDNAVATLTHAHDPKQLYTIEGCNHGYCPKMHEELVEGLELIFGEQ